MIEKALLIALVALAVIAGAGAIGSTVGKMLDGTDCALRGASVCAVDGE